jgi:hypothetical protein
LPALFFVEVNAGEDGEEAHKKFKVEGR